MKRKLFSTMLCAVALVLLMGAGVESDSSAATVNEEESTSVTQSEQVLETGTPTGTEQSPESQPQEGEQTGSAETAENEQTGAEAENEAEAPAVEEPPVVEVPPVDPNFLIDGQPVHKDTGRMLVKDVTYVAMGPTVKEIAPDAQITWDGKNRIATVKTGKLTLTAKVGDVYAVANGRYLYAPDGIKMQGDRVMIPLKILTRAFDAKLSWNSSTRVVAVQRGSGAIVSGDQFYNQDSLFWLSRVIYAESGNQSLKGKMAVGNVVMNRVNSPLFPNTILGVLSQRNQFTTYRGGNLAYRTPNEGSVLAAKLVLDGAVVEESCGALYFDSLANSWASRHKTFVCKLGAHKFYR